MQENFKMKHLSKSGIPAQININIQNVHQKEVE